MLGFLCKHILFYIGILVSNFLHNMDSKMTLWLIHWLLAKRSHYYSLTNPYLRSYLWLTNLIHFQNAIFYYILVIVKLPSKYNQTYLSWKVCRYSTISSLKITWRYLQTVGLPKSWWSPKQCSFQERCHYRNDESVIQSKSKRWSADFWVSFALNFHRQKTSWQFQQTGKLKLKQQRDILQEKKIVGSDIAGLHSLIKFILVVHSFFDVEFLRGRLFDRITFFQNSSVVLSKFICCSFEIHFGQKMTFF